MLNLVFLIWEISVPGERVDSWGHRWTDYGLFAIFVLYTVEIGSRIIVQGLFIYPKDEARIREWFRKPQRRDNLHFTNPTILRKDPNAFGKRMDTFKPAATFRHERTPSSPPIPHITEGSRATTIIDFAVGRQTTVGQLIPAYLDPIVAYRPQFVDSPYTEVPFLRHTFNRIDFVAVISYWIDFILMLSGVQHVYIFKTIAAMRTIRLINITSGSETILRSLKKSAPLLVNDVGENYEEAVSFDAMYSALIPVYVLMTGQTWTDLMYVVMDAEYPWSSIYFVVVVLIMNFWILNLFIAVINEMFAKIRDDSHNNSAFTTSEIKNSNILTESTEGYTYRPEEMERVSSLRMFVDRLECLWVIAIVVDLCFQCLRRYNMTSAELARLERIEFWFTIAFAVDIIIRFLVYLPKPKSFFKSKKNCMDLFLAIVTLIIQIGPIRNSSAYKYLTVFQVLRIYRPVIYVERLRSLIVRVLGSLAGLTNLLFFIGMFLAIVAVMAALMFRGVIDESEHMNFSDFYTSYLGVYQVFSGENWTEILYSAMKSELSWRQVAFAAIFIIAFYSFANFVLVNMLIAIIMENFEIPESSKRSQQIEEFVSKMGGALREVKWDLYRYLKPIPNSIGIDNMSSGIIHKRRKYLVRQFLLGDAVLFRSDNTDALKQGDENKGGKDNKTKAGNKAAGGKGVRFNQNEHHDGDKSAMAEMRIDALIDSHRERDALKDTLLGSDSQTRVPLTFQDPYLYASPPKATEPEDQTEPFPSERRRFFSKDSLQTRSLFLFSYKSKVRRFCQRIVSPGRGYRSHGVSEHPVWSRIFNTTITIAIFACVLVAIITTPVWRFHQSRLPPDEKSIAIRVSDFVFPAIFTVEFLIRVIADGFLFTPDAYLKTLWNKIDLFVLITLYIPIFADLAKSQGVSRFVRSLKALRALRLINQSAYIKETFYAVLVKGFPRLFDAALLSLAMIVPFAIYGLHLFNGLFYSCNDESVSTMQECVGTFVDDSNGVPMVIPRIWDNPSVYSFNNFGASFLILFEIVSQEGWSGVMNTARDIVGFALQPSQDAGRYNAIFFVVFNLAGGYFVTSLFVAIVIENYTMRTGTALMTANQRRWMDLKKLLGGIKMSKRRLIPPTNRFRRLCFTIASPKKSLMNTFLTCVTMLIGVLLMTENIHSNDWEWIKDWIFLGLLSFLIMEVVIKVSAFGWNSFRKNRWNMYNAVLSIAAFFITILRVVGVTYQPLVQTQKLCLTAILLRLVPRSDSLNQLFMTMASSLRSIGSLLGVWLVVFTVYGIMFVEVFGLTKYGENGGTHVNFRSFPSALLMMVRMSTGEGWNDLMHDFAVEKPECVNQPENYLESDCGSTAWAYTLFITFNIISMYIFTNMFIVVVMHNFSYVYQIAPGFSLVTRDQIRQYKRAWAEVDVDQTGYIQEKDLVRFLMKLRGSFDLRIHAEEHSLARLQSHLETARPNAVSLTAKEIAARESQRRVLVLNDTKRRGGHHRAAGSLGGSQDMGSGGNTSMSTMNGSGSNSGGLQNSSGSMANDDEQDLRYKLDLDYNLLAFNSATANIDRAKIRRRRRRFNFLYNEVVMSMEPIPTHDSKKANRLSGSFLGLRFGSGGGEKSKGRSSAAATFGSSSQNAYEMAPVASGPAENLDAKKRPMGISFQKMLNILAHYTLIEDDQCLLIGDLLRHRQKMDRIYARVHTQHVRSVLLMVMLRQRFKKHYRQVQAIRAKVQSGSPGSGPSGSGSSSMASAGKGLAKSASSLPTRSALSTPSSNSSAPTLAATAAAASASSSSTFSAQRAGGSRPFDQEQYESSGVTDTQRRTSLDEFMEHFYPAAAGAMSSTPSPDPTQQGSPQPLLPPSTLPREDSSVSDTTLHPLTTVMVAPSGPSGIPSVQIQSSGTEEIQEEQQQQQQHQPPSDGLHFRQMDQDTAQAMVDSLRSDWRSFISNYDLSVDLKQEYDENGLPQDPFAGGSGVEDVNTDTSAMAVRQEPSDNVVIDSAIHGHARTSSDDSAFVQVQVADANEEVSSHQGHSWTSRPSA
ncbi:calcium channel protein [Actinomortierella wolfii]|nr:calcium channel protein [Actinomortierella wolfii]